MLNQLPPGSQQPVLTVQIGQTDRRDVYRLRQRRAGAATRSPTIWSASCSRSCRRCRACRPRKCSARSNFALRAWLDPKKLAAYGLTAADVVTALGAQRLHLGPRHHQGPDGAGQPDRVDRPAYRSSEFANSIVKQADGAIVRLKDVANVTLGADDYETEVAFDGKPAVYIGIQVAPTANLLDVIAGVHKVFPDIQAQLPQRPARRRSSTIPPNFVNTRDPRRGADPGRGAADRQPRGVPVPGLAAFGRDPDGRDSAVAGRRLHR